MTRLGAKVLWLGHQQNDVAESMLMRLARGSGGGGLAAPRPVQAVQGGRLHLRPLLTVKHGEITAMLEAVQAPWREDATNLTDSHFRNRIRGAVIPAWIQAAGRDALAGAARARELLEEDDAALEAWVDATALFKAGGAMDLTKLQGQPRALARRALHRWLMRQREAGELSRQAFETLLHAVIDGRATRQSVGTAGFALIRQGFLKFERARRKRRSRPGGL
jgi:tRNA(Ile)-lysidine synthase